MDFLLKRNLQLNSKKFKQLYKILEKISKILLDVLNLGKIFLALSTLVILILEFGLF